MATVGLVAGAALVSVVIGLTGGLVRPAGIASGGRRSAGGGPLGRTSRRGLLRWATIGALAVLGAQASVAAVRFLRTNRVETFGQSVVATTLAGLPAIDGPPLRSQAGHFYLMRQPEGLLAFSWQCPHLGCTVPWVDNEGQFHCPCHDSLYDRYGEVRSGPAPRPLDLMPITIQGDRVIVATGTIIQRTDFRPEQVVPLP